LALKKSLCSGGFFYFQFAGIYFKKNSVLKRQIFGFYRN